MGSEEPDAINHICELLLIRIDFGFANSRCRSVSSYTGHACGRPAQDYAGAGNYESAASTVAAIAVSLLMSTCGLNGYGIISKLGAPLSRHTDRSGAELAFPEISRTWQCGNCSLNLTAKAMPSISGIMTSLTTM